MKIAILGFASQGQSAYEYWNRPDNQITICDANEELIIPEGAASHLGASYLANLDAFDMLVRTPVLHPRDIVAANPESPDILNKVWTNTNEFFKVCPTKNVIGITGTKGKGTTSTLVTRILESTGERVHLGGNIGIPPLELLKDDIQTDDWVVLELANFQLIDLKYSPHIAACLMIEPEHLDWHEDIDEYLDAKQQLFMQQTDDDIAIYYSPNDNSLSVAGASEGELIPYYEKPGAIVEKNVITIDGQEICKTSDLKLLGTHNWQNVCAAVTVAWQITQDVTAISTAVKSFSGLPFRIELRDAKHGVHYYNDSFASVPAATSAAMQAIPGMKVLIIGGYDRNLDLGDLSTSLLEKKNEIRSVVLIGASAERTAKVLKDAGFTNYVVTTEDTMDGIIRLATEQAQQDDAVVLSPGFPSFDMFKNFEDRGRQFNDAVAAL